MPLLDAFQRPFRNLRISVTDRCNLRCAYCMPEEEYTWLPRRDLLSFEEIRRITRVFTEQGVRRVRLTGGEPLLRRELPDLVAMLAADPSIEDLALTTNGLLLADLAGPLRAAGLHRLNVSLDTLREDRFLALTRRPGPGPVLEGLAAAAAAGFTGTRIDTVVLRDTNADEIGPLLAFGRERGCEVRFIEYMDVGGATQWRRELVVPQAEILERVAQACGPPQPLARTDSAPASRWRLPDGTVFGIIASVTAPFCADCDRSRLTADGRWYRCLYAREGTDLRKPLRAGAGDPELAAILAAAWAGRADRGAEERLGLQGRRPLAAAAELRDDPHLEMHTRGG